MQISINNDPKYSNKQVAPLEQKCQFIINSYKELAPPELWHQPFKYLTENYYELPSTGVFFTRTGYWVKSMNS